jgi:hypothetical protein
MAHEVSFSTEQFCLGGFGRRPNSFVGYLPAIASSALESQSAPVATSPLRAAQQAIVQCDKGAGEVSHFARQPAFRTTFSMLRWLRSFSASILLSARSAISISASASIFWESGSALATRLV